MELLIPVRQLNVMQYVIIANGKSRLVGNFYGHILWQELIYAVAYSAVASIDQIDYNFFGFDIPRNHFKLILILKAI